MFILFLWLFFFWGFSWLEEGLILLLFVCGILEYRLCWLVFFCLFCFLFLCGVFFEWMSCVVVLGILDFVDEEFFIKGFLLIFLFGIRVLWENFIWFFCVWLFFEINLDVLILLVDILEFFLFK